MSLRLRLTLLYTGLLSITMALGSVVLLTLVNIILTNQYDNQLQISAETVIDNLYIDPTGDLELNQSTLQVDKAVQFQVWSNEGRLLVTSDNISQMSNPLDSEAFTTTQPVFNRKYVGETLYRVLTAPMVIDGEDFGKLQVSLSLRALNDAQRLILAVYSLSSVFIIILVAAVSWLITGRVLEPLEEMSQISLQITGSNDLSKRIPVSTQHNDEINTLALSYNQTLVRLERLFNAQRRFLADVSHELRTPLTVIKGNIGLMRVMHTYDKESLKSIDLEVDRLTRMVSDLLVISQAETGNLPLIFEPIALDDLLFEVFGEMKILSEGQHTITIDNVEPVVISGDRDRLKQVFLNLGGNAVKYAPEGSSISLSLVVGEGWVNFNIKDQGPGISKEDLSHIFERFYASDKSRTRSKKFTGYGLGLPIAYWIVRNHGGRIDVDSKLGEGSTFSVWLPKSGNK